MAAQLSHYYTCYIDINKQIFYRGFIATKSQREFFNHGFRGFHGHTWKVGKDHKDCVFASLVFLAKPAFKACFNFQRVSNETFLWEITLIYCDRWLNSLLDIN
jgi:hypothetical protein